MGKKRNATDKVSEAMRRPIPPADLARYWHVMAEAYRRAAADADRMAAEIEKDIPAWEAMHTPAA